jgi:drug/metabolite transporter (DMT)-like permease
MKWLLLALVVIPGTVGDVLMTMGMKRHGEIDDFGWRNLLSLLWDMVRNPYLIVGIVAMAVSFFALMALLSVAQLSFAVPATASSYLVETALAKYVLKEEVDAARWAGACLVTVGVVLASL